MRQRTSSAPLCRGLAGAALLLCVHLAGAQEIYKSVDAAGNVVYSDRGSTKNSPATTLHVTQGDAAEAARLAQQQRLLNAENKERQRQDALEAKNHSTAVKERQKACEAARSKYYQYKDSNRLYTRDADGNKVWLSDDSADAMREQARRTMVAACGP